MSITAGGPRSMLAIRKESVSPDITVLYLTGRIAMGRPCQDIEANVDDGQHRVWNDCDVRR